MNIIVEEPHFISSVLGRQTINLEVQYRPISFLIESKCSDGFLVYNTLTKKMLLLNENEYKHLKLGGPYTPYLERFIESYFLVPQDFEETKCFHQIQNVFNTMDNDDYINSFIVLPTTDCNARCFYCCEKGQKRINMTLQTAADTADFIIQKSKGKEVYIMWFGGEPLYNIDAINHICEILKKANIIFKSNMISNAYLFDSETIQMAKSYWNLKSVQVTLDGTEEIYNKTKAYIHKEDLNPFKRVIKNIKKLAENQVFVIVRLNMDFFNKDNLYQLVDLLYKSFGGNKYVKIYVRMLFDDTGILQINRSNANRKKLFEELSDFEDYIKTKGMYHYKKLHSVYTGNNGCIGASKHGTVIMPNGELGLCDICTDSYHYGDIYNGVRDQSVIDAFLEKKEPVDNCNKCPLVPNCFRLKACKYFTRECEDYEQNKRIKDMQSYIYYTYECWKNKI